MDEVQKFLEQHLALPAPPVQAVRRKDFTPELRAADEAKRQITFVSSTESLDRMGDRIIVAGWDFRQYRKNPVVLWAHQSSAPPVAKCVEIHTEQAPVPALVQTFEFATKDVYPFADVVYNLYRNKFLSSVSVGFMPTAPPQQIKDDSGSWSGGYEFNGTTLLETSCVPIPANPEAVARALDAGIITKSDAARAFAEDARASVGVARALLSAHAAKAHRPVVRCSDEEAVMRAELICALTSVFQKIVHAEMYLMLLPQEFRDEFNAIIARMFPLPIEEFLEGLTNPDPDTLDGWLEALAGS